MKATTLLLLFLSLSLSSALSIELYDRPSYKFTTLSSPPPQDSSYTSIHTSDNATHIFKETSINTIKNTNNVSFIISKVLHLRDKVFEHRDGDIKFMVKLFDRVTMATEEGTILVGVYSGSSYKDNKYVQYYLNGDECDIYCGRKRSFILTFEGGDGEMELLSPKEFSTCRYKSTILGKGLVDEVTYKTIAYYREEEGKEKEKEGEEKEKEKEK